MKSFRAEKRWVRIEVDYNEEVQITVINTFAETENAAIMIAKSEQILAHIHLGKTPHEDPLSELMVYFSNRGWKILDTDDATTKTSSL